MRHLTICVWFLYFCDSLPNDYTQTRNLGMQQFIVEESLLVTWVLPLEQVEKQKCVWAASILLTYIVEVCKQGFGDFRIQHLHMLNPNAVLVCRPLLYFLVSGVRRQGSLSVLWWSRCGNVDKVNSFYFSNGTEFLMVCTSCTLCCWPHACCISGRNLAKLVLGPSPLLVWSLVLNVDTRLGSESWAGTSGQVCEGNWTFSNVDWCI